MSEPDDDERVERFRHLAAVALADGELSTGETQLLLHFAIELGLGRERGGRLLREVLAGQLPAIRARAGEGWLEDLVAMVLADGRATKEELTYVRALCSSSGVPTGRLEELLADAMLGRAGVTSAGTQASKPSATSRPASRAPEPEPPPPEVGNYTLGRELGRGAAGVVYQGRHKLLGHEVAIKLFPSSESTRPAQRERFLREVRAAARLKHPHILPTLDAGEADEVPYLVMELVPEGETFQSRLDRGESFEPLEAARALGQIAAAVSYAHGEGLLHRDLKPGNVLVPRDGQPRLGDFGLLGEVGEAATGGRLVGTPPFMAPEQMRGVPGDRLSDVYGLGATLYTLLTGEPPFEAEGLVQLAVRVIQDPPEPPSARRRGVPPALDQVVLRCLEKEPAQRYPDAAALATDLERVTRRESSLLGKLSRRLRKER
ncbi:MAG: protein kinase [Planctomycetota bacterium]